MGKEELIKRVEKSQKKADGPKKIKPLIIKQGTYGIIANPGINCSGDY